MLENREGQKVPNVTFKTRSENSWVDVTTEELFANKKVIVFSLPGAFTPTCSASHLPRYNELAPVFKENGVDDIVCMSVNDAFVMNSWKEDQEAENVTLIPDGNGEFSEHIGMLVDKSAIGFGKRSWRYSMVVDNGVIEKMFIEPQVEGDPYEVSDADTMLEYIAPNASVPKFFTLFTRRGCPHCSRAKNLLEQHNMLYEEIELGRQVTSKSLKAVTNATTTPQVFHEGKRIGTADDLEAFFNAL